MKKTISLLGIASCIFSQTLKAQQVDINYGDFTRPVPTVSSLGAYNSVAQSNVTGLPPVSFPLLQLPSRSQNIELGVSLSYNLLNMDRDEPAADAGTGWSLFGGGVISRTIENKLDEMYYDVTINGYKKNQFDDIYYYNIPGESGKFKFVRDTNANTFELVNLSPNKLKIEYTRTSNTATLILKSFTITDAKGNKFLFNDYSLANLDGDPHGYQSNEYRSAFYLTKIVDANNVELANYSYEKKSKDKVMFAGEKVYQYCKLKTITSPGLGRIEFDYLFSEPWKMNDPYQVEKVTLKDQAGHTISSYAFEYSYFQYEDVQLAGGPMEYIYKRKLERIKKLDRNNVVSETTAFEYSNVAYSPSRPGGGYPISAICDVFKYITSPELVVYSGPVLKRVISPSSGVVEYNYEFGQIYKNRADPTYLSTILNGTDFIDSEIQYLRNLKTLTADTRVSGNQTLNISGTARKKLIVTMSEIEVVPPTPELDPWDNPITIKYLTYDIKKSNGALVGYALCKDNYGPRIYDLEPGDYIIEVYGTEGREGIEQISIYDFIHTPQPFPNSTQGGGLRIGNIKYYNSKADVQPLKTTRFEYSDFTDPLASSGYMFTPEMDETMSRYTLYKNVKVIDDNGGYTKFYYRTPDEFPQVPYAAGRANDKFWANYSAFSGGILEKKEIYDVQNKLLVKEQSDYLFEEIPGAVSYQLFHVGTNGSYPKTYSKSIWLKKLTNTATSYFENGRSIQQKSETDFGVFNFQPVKVSKEIDGNIEEQLSIYPETGYPNLKNANMINVPVVVEGKRNGVLISRTETKYNSPTNLNPSAIFTSNIGNTAQKMGTMDLYDENGNIIQFTPPDGKPITVIYGYNKTQPIARIEGATYAQVSGLVSGIINASDADAADSSKEALLLSALDDFRNNSQLSGFMITTYTYDPLIGATTVTPPNGIREIYKYDSQNRLLQIVDMKGMILKEYKYNYKN